MTTLPDKPSALIRSALDDLAKVEAMPETYEVDMSVWHEPNGDKCFVCLAGARMAMSLESDPGRDLLPDDEWINDEEQCRIEALDSFRRGGISAGLDELGIDWFETGLPAAFIAITPYEDDPSQFRADMLAMAAMLEGHGL